MAVTDEKGNIVGTYEYSPYGQILHKEGTANITFLYNGQYGVATDENGLYYMRARYYNVDIKRFINQDVLTGTLERISSLNRYAYVEGNPINYLDPFGLEAYDTSTLHNAAMLIGLASYIITLVIPNIGIVISTSANGFDIGLYLYDGFYDIKEGNIQDLLSDLKGIVIDLIGILTVGIANGYLKAAEDAANFKGIMQGYEQQLSLLYDQWNYIDKMASRGIVGKQIIEKFRDFKDYLKKKMV